MVTSRVSPSFIAMTDFCETRKDSGRLRGSEITQCRAKMTQREWGAHMHFHRSGAWDDGTLGRASKVPSKYMGRISTLVRSERSPTSGLKSPIVPSWRRVPSGKKQDHMAIVHNINCLRQRGAVSPFAIDGLKVCQSDRNRRRPKRLPSKK